jgi:hypothetical protein
VIQSCATAGTARIREATSRELDRWDELVGKFPGCRVTHKRGWIGSLEASFGGKALYLVYEKAGDVVACLPGLLVTKGFFRIFGSPLQGWQTVSMGPVFDAERITTAEMMGSLVDFLEQQHGVHHVELMTSRLDQSSMAGLGFRGEPVLTYRAPLCGGDEASMMKTWKPSARRNVRRAVRLGLVTRFEDNERFVDEAYDQIKEVFAYGGNLVSFSKNRVLQFFRHMKSNGTLRAVSVYLPPENVTIATGLFTVDGNELLLWQWAHRRQHRWYRPTELMTLTVMADAVSQGCNTLDLMGGGKFKAQFGAEPDVSKYRWVRSRYRYLARLRDCARMCYRAHQRVRGQVARLRLSLASLPHRLGANASDPK